MILTKIDHSSQQLVWSIFTFIALRHFIEPIAALDMIILFRYLPEADPEKIYLGRGPDSMWPTATIVFQLERWGEVCAGPYPLRGGGRQLPP